jgi:hypothetical protein
MEYFFLGCARWRITGIRDMSLFNWDLRSHPPGYFLVGRPIGLC